MKLHKKETISAHLLLMFCKPGNFLFAAAAQDAGYFNAEMAPIEVKTKKGKESVAQDEHPRPQTTLEQLGKLPTVFKKDGTVTAGNASVSTQFLKCLNSDIKRVVCR